MLKKEIIAKMHDVYFVLKSDPSSTFVLYLWSPFVSNFVDSNMKAKYAQFWSNITLGPSQTRAKVNANNGI